MGHRKHILWEKWEPSVYLKTYFSKIGPDTYETIRFIHEELSQFNKNTFNKVLDFGAGPTVIIALLVAPYAKKVHLAEYLDINLNEIDKWIKDHPKAFSWDHCIHNILTIEGGAPNLQTIKKRAQELRRKSILFECDAALTWPLGEKHKNYPLIISAFCADSSTSSKRIWRKYMFNILRLVGPNGHIFLACLRKCKKYKVGSHEFPSANINEVDVLKVLNEAGFKNEKIKIKICPTPECIKEGFSSIILARASR